MKKMVASHRTVVSPMYLLGRFANVFKIGQIRHSSCSVKVRNALGIQGILAEPPERTSHSIYHIYNPLMSTAWRFRELHGRPCLSPNISYSSPQHRRSRYDCREGSDSSPKPVHEICRKNMFSTVSPGFLITTRQGFLDGAALFEADEVRKFAGSDSPSDYNNQSYHRYVLCMTRKGYGLALSEHPG